MLISHARDLTFRNEPAELYVLRSDGFCWGRLKTKTADFDVNPEEDWYDYPDEDVLDFLEELLNHPAAIAPAAGRLF